MGVPDVPVPLAAVAMKTRANPFTPRDKTWAQALGQKETAVAFAKLPPGLHFGEEFPEPISHDTTRKLLVYRGFMYHGSYMYLHELSADPAYIAAIDQLYIASSATRARQGGQWWGIATGAVLILVIWWYFTR